MDHDSWFTNIVLDTMEHTHTHMEAVCEHLPPQACSSHPSSRAAPLPSLLPLPQPPTRGLHSSLMMKSVRTLRHPRTPHATHSCPRVRTPSTPHPAAVRSTTIAALLESECHKCCPRHLAAPRPFPTFPQTLHPPPRPASAPPTCSACSMSWLRPRPPRHVASQASRPRHSPPAATLQAVAPQRAARTAER